MEETYRYKEGEVMEMVVGETRVMGWLDGEGRRMDLHVTKTKLTTNIVEEKKRDKK